MNDHLGVKPYPCQECDETFGRLSRLYKHVAEEHGQHACNHKDCTKTFSSTKSLTIHKQKHLVDKVCQECGARFALEQVLRVHLRTHSRPFVCNQPGCEQAFSTKESLAVHVNRHVGQTPFACTKCKKSFFSNHALQIHTKTHTRKHACTVAGCDQRFAHSSQLKVHLATHKTSVVAKPYKSTKYYKCTKCTRVFDCPSRLFDHGFLHSGQTTCTYEECGESFSNRQQFEYHTNAHLGITPYKCFACEASFASPQQRNQHMFVVHSGKSTCPNAGCGMSFSAQSSLRVHVLATCSKREGVGA